MVGDGLLSARREDQHETLTLLASSDSPERRDEIVEALRRDVTDPKFLQAILAGGVDESILSEVFELGLTVAEEAELVSRLVEHALTKIELRELEGIENALILASAFSSDIDSAHAHSLIPSRYSNQIRAHLVRAQDRLPGGFEYDHVRHMLVSIAEGLDIDLD